MPRPRKLHPYPYFKVQFHHASLRVWRDHRREVFQNLSEAMAYAASLPRDLLTRIVCWDEQGSRTVLLDE
jgi:hypothetical protein